MADEGSIPELIDALRWRWKLVVLFAIPLLAGVVFYAESLPLEWEGEAIITVAPRPELEGISPSQVTVGAPKYVAYITAASTIRNVAPTIGEDPSVIEKAIDATLAADTGDITITMTLPSPERAMVAANTFARETVRFSVTDPLLSAAIVAPAALPGQASGPPKRLIEAAGLLVGLILGVAAAFLVERSRPRLRTWRDIAVLTGLPVVGRLPMSKGLRSGAPTGPYDPILGASVRNMRTNLERELGTEPKGVLVVTSSGPDEGKTATSGVFATALARLDIRVLLIDADLHRTGLSRAIGMDRSEGLAGILRGQTRLEDAVRPGWTPGLTILPSAPDPDAGELIARGFEDVLQAVRGAFDIVIVDAPPLLGGDDASTLATMSDGVLLIVSIGTMAGPASEAVLGLRGLRVPVWGVVANKVPRTGPGGAANYVYSAAG